jgi:hypothetical protein
MIYYPTPQQAAEDLMNLQHAVDRLQRESKIIASAASAFGLGVYLSGRFEQFNQFEVGMLIFFAIAATLLASYHLVRYFILVVNQIKQRTKFYADLVTDPEVRRNLESDESSTS